MSRLVKLAEVTEITLLLNYEDALRKWGKLVSKSVQVSNDSNSSLYSNHQKQRAVSPSVIGGQFRKRRKYFFISVHRIQDCYHNSNVCTVSKSLCTYLCM